MRRSYLALFVLFMFSGCVLSFRIYEFRVEALNGYPVHNLNTGLNYTTIQESIDASETSDGNTILVDAGIYNETILIDKSVSLVGENSSSTVLNATLPDYDPFDRAMINITASNVQVTGFNIAGWYFDKVSASQCSNITIRDNMIQSTGSCISLSNVSNSTIERNIVVGGGLEGNNLVNLASCSNCMIKNNTITDACYNGITLGSSHYNIISDNKIFHDNYAIYLYLSTQNLILNNNITDVGTGIEFDMSASHNTVIHNVILDTGHLFWMIKSRENTIFHNSFGLSRYDRVYGWDYYNVGHWNSSTEGNYWSDYNGTDGNQDGIGDTPYIIDASNIDHCPLMGTFQCFNVSVHDTFESIYLVSNSTIVSIEYEVAIPENEEYPAGTILFLRLFPVIGENGTIGFCRIVIPDRIFNSTDYQIVAGKGYEIPTRLPCSNSTHTFLYFTYNTSIVQNGSGILIEHIVPEFPSFLILPLFFMATLLTIIFCRKKLARTA
jgi:parallel beta-helix repeat protein